MSEVKRFDTGTDNTHYYGVPVMEECEDGDYVLAADYDALKEERDQLRAELAAIRASEPVGNGWRPVPIDSLTNILRLIDPQPIMLPNGKTMVFVNPHAAEVLTRISAEVRAMLATTQDIAVSDSEPLGWITDDYDTDKSATTYAKAIAEHWRAKGWDVRPIYTTQQPQPAEQQDTHPLIKTLHDNGELIAREATISQQAQMIEALQSELNEKRENICRLLIELDELKAPRHGHCNHGPEKTCGRCTADEGKA